MSAPHIPADTPRRTNTLAVAQHSVLGEDHSASRLLLKTELKDRITYVQDELLQAVGAIGGIHNPEDTRCLALLQTQRYQRLFYELTIATNENQMYSPLADILNGIMNSYLTPADYRRCFSTASRGGMKSTTNCILPNRCPDLALIDLEPGAADATTPVPWIHLAMAIEVKAKDSEAPEPSARDTIKQVISQAADYARLHLSLRPFQLYSFVLLICGSTFTLTFFDRTGVVVSQNYTFANDLLIFIRLIRRLSREMSLYDLGLDPTVELVEGQTMLTKPYPSFKVLVEGNYKTYQYNDRGPTNKYWTTDGLPVWQSLTLVGRGTSTWRVIDEHKTPHILKNTWRDGVRESESRIYLGLLASELKGIAKFSIGGDVLYRDGSFISCQNVRQRHGVTPSPNFPMSKLHRFVLKSVGKPLWKYSTAKQFIRAMIDIIDGHEILLSKQGRLHRDISAGNLFLSEDFQAEHCYGFLADIELSKRVEPRSHMPIHSENPNPPLTGTAQFMAIAILLRCLGVEGFKDVVHSAHHDLESIVWVTLYSILMHEIIGERDGVIFLSARAKDKEDKFSYFRRLFSRTSYEEIELIRKHCMESVGRVITMIKAPVLQKLISALLRLVWQQNNSWNQPIYITHQSLRAAFDDARKGL